MAEGEDGSDARCSCIARLLTAFAMVAAMSPFRNTYLVSPDQASGVPVRNLLANPSIERDQHDDALEKGGEEPGRAEVCERSRPGAA